MDQTQLAIEIVELIGLVCICIWAGRFWQELKGFYRLLQNKVTDHEPAIRDNEDARVAMAKAVLRKATSGDNKGIEIPEHIKSLTPVYGFRPENIPWILAKDMEWSIIFQSEDDADDSLRILVYRDSRGNNWYIEIFEDHVLTQTYTFDYEPDEEGHA